MKTLITGVGSGLGKFLLERLGGDGFTRTDGADMARFSDGPPYDVIIHCAFNSSRPVTSDNLGRFLKDNIDLTKSIVSIPHKKIIYMSSIDVYPKTPGAHVEDERIDLDKVDKFYGLFKLAGEAVIRDSASDYLILRSTALLGKYSRKNSLIKIITREPCVLPLTENSVFNYVRHVDVADFISLALESGLSGMYNLVSSKNITLGQAAGMLKKNVTFGPHFYTAGNISNDKVSAVAPVFKQTSTENIMRFIEEDLHQPVK